MKKNLLLLIGLLRFRNLKFLKLNCSIKKVHIDKLNEIARKYNLIYHRQITNESY